MSLTQWAERHNIPRAALDELLSLTLPPAPVATGGSEMQVQQLIRAEAPFHGARLWRNNSGVGTDDSGRVVRFGLGNDSAKINKVFKMGDLIGITPVTVTPDMVGHPVGVFTMAEVKKPGWRKPSNDRERAQAAAILCVQKLGGYAGFVSDVSHYLEMINAPETAKTR